MKLNKLYAAIVLVAGITPGFALANGTNPVGAKHIYISGSSATDTFLERAFSTVSQAGTYDAYIILPAKEQRIYSYTSNGADGFANGTLIVAHKTSVGGSGNGVGPVGNRTNLDFLSTVTDVKAACTTGAAATGIVTPLTNYTIHNCDAFTVALHLPDFGISDVEPAIFGDYPASPTNLQFAGTNDLVFAVFATQELRDRLQTAQGLTVGDNSEAQMPSLTREQLTAVMTGLITSVADFSDKDGNQLTNTAGGADGTIRFCRRVDTSGTEKTSEIVFANKPCSPDATAFVGGNQIPVDPNVSPFNYSDLANRGNTVFNGSATGDVKYCLNYFNQTIDDTLTGEVAGTATHLYAIGIMSTENKSGNGTTTGDQWRAIKIDGYAPTLLNTVEGKYPYFGSITMNWPNPALTGTDGETLRSHLLNIVQATSLVVAINTGFQSTWGDGGYLVPFLNNVGASPTLPSAAPAGRLTQAELRTNPINAVTKASSGSIKNCSFPAPASQTTVYSIAP